MDRNELEQKLAKQGYQHPETPAQNVSAYQKYSDGKGNDPYTSQVYDPYATFDTEDKPKVTQKSDICPVCQQKALYTCECADGEFMCSAGHAWYFLVSGKLVIGDPHEEDD